MKNIVYLTIVITFFLGSCQKDNLLKKEPTDQAAQELLLVKENTEINGIWGDLYHNLLPDGEVQEIFFAYPESNFNKVTWTGTFRIDSYWGGYEIYSCKGDAKDCLIKHGMIIRNPPEDDNPGD